jgi:hypothetical protein
MNIRDRLGTILGHAESGPAPVERMLRRRFHFLVEEQGFELVRTDALANGAIAAYKNVPARRAVMVLARADKGVWAGIGPLDDTGRLTTLDRRGIEQGRWRPLGEVNLGSGVRTLEEAIERLAESLRRTR